MRKVSIITVCFNSAATLENTILSIESQDYPNIEYIVVDGASMDGTLAIIEKHKTRINKFISEKDNGMYFAINKGISLATGDIIGLLHSDDFYVRNDVISRVVKRFEESGADAVYGDLQYVKRNDPKEIVRNWIAKPYESNMFLFGWMPPHPTFFVKKECIENYGNYNTSLHFAADYELMLRLVHKHGIKVSYLHELLVRMRIGGISNTPFTNRIRVNLEERRCWKINNLKPYFFTSFLKPIRKVGQFFIERDIKL